MNHLLYFTLLFFFFVETLQRPRFSFRTAPAMKIVFFFFRKVSKVGKNVIIRGLWSSLWKRRKTLAAGNLRSIRVTLNDIKDALCALLIPRVLFTAPPYLRNSIYPKELRLKTQFLNDFTPQRILRLANPNQISLCHYPSLKKLYKVHRRMIRRRQKEKNNRNLFLFFFIHLWIVQTFDVCVYNAKKPDGQSFINFTGRTLHSTYFSLHLLRFMYFCLYLCVGHKYNCTTHLPISQSI